MPKLVILTDFCRKLAKNTKIGDFEFESSSNAAEMAKIPKLPDLIVLPDLDVDFPENRQFWHF